MCNASYVTLNLHITANAYSLCSTKSRLTLTPTCIFTLVFISDPICTLDFFRLVLFANIKNTDLLFSSHYCIFFCKIIRYYTNNHNNQIIIGYHYLPLNNILVHL